MKKFLFLLSFLFLGLAAIAQPYTISISGVVVDNDGNAVEGVEIIISTDSTAGAPVYYNTVYTDSNGFFSDSFTSENAWGSVLVTMVNCPNVPNETVFLSWQSGNAEFTVTFLYCGATSNCSVFIEADSTGFFTTLNAIATGTAPFSYQWSTGETTASINVSDPGTYCVTVTDNTGCTADACYTIADPGACWVGIEANPSGGLSAWTQGGTPPYTFLWSTGATTQTILPNAPGEYCVTVTDATGCVAEDCYWYQGGGGDTLCWVEIIPQQIPGTTGYTLTAVPGGEAPFTYFWSTNETTAEINVTESGTYCVTVADNAGCTSTSCITIQILQENDVVSGFVYAGDSLFNPIFLEGWAFLIEYDPTGGTLTAVDSTEFTVSPNQVGFYSFGSVPPGDYLVKAFLNPDSDGYEDYLPTYHYSYLHWDEADEVTVPYMGQQYFDIALIPGNNPGGPGFIGGLVSEGANIWGGNEEVRGGVGDPMHNVSILLLDEFESPVTHTLTSMDGTFTFENLAWGTYKVEVEIPGLEQGEKWVTIGPDNPGADISFDVGENGVVSALIQIDQVVESLAYPNPVSDLLSVYFSTDQPAEGHLSLLSLDGKTELMQVLDLHSGGQVLSVPVADLPSGMYILQATTENWTISHRVVIE